MVSGCEIKRNLLGTLEISLFMAVPADRFDKSREAMLRSFYIPVFLFPLTLLLINFNPALQEVSANKIALLYSLRMWVSLGFFLGFVWLLCRKTDRMDRFRQFVTANNWLSLPAALLFVPVLLVFSSGGHSWQEMQPFMMFLVLYSYAITAFMAAYVLNIPFELGGFVGFIAMAANNGAHDFIRFMEAAIL